MSIHPTAIVDPNAQVADSAEVQPFAIIGPHVIIGEGTIIGPHSVIDGRTALGDNVHIYSGAQVGIRSQDMKHDPGLVGSCSIGANTIIREHVTVSASTMSSPEDEYRETVIGGHCLLMAYSHVGHDCHIGDHVWMSNCTSLAGHIVVESHAILSGLVGVHQECAIGAYSFVSGMSRINMDVPPYMIVEGNPAKCHGPNNVGLRRKGFDDEARARIKQMYRIMCRSNLNVTQALHQIENEVEDSPERNSFIEFYRKSIRGVTR